MKLVYYQTSIIISFHLPSDTTRPGRPCCCITTLTVDQIYENQGYVIKVNNSSGIQLLVDKPSTNRNRRILKFIRMNRTIQYCVSRYDGKELVLL